MSTTIDERIVSMKFDNKDFEKNVAQTIDTLEKLDKQLDFKDAEKNFKKIEDASNEVTLSGLTKSAEAVKVEFSVMSMFAISAINKIVDTTFDAGVKMVKNLSVDQITAGFGKYEQKLNSVQAIMNTTGKTIEEVELQMSKLMTYTDETSYSFTDMVANIGTFTSNRIDLETATKSMMGIANAAGFAGVNSEKATHAMTGFSKAMAKGFMDRQSWQWIQTAGMAIPELKEQFIEAAVAEEKLIKVGDGLYKTLKGNTVSVADFESAMKDGWLTTEVLNKSLNKFGSYSEELMKIMDETGMTATDAMAKLDAYIKESGDETLAYSAKMFKAAQAYRTFGDAVSATRDAVSTGWMKTFDIIFGNLEEAQELWETVGGLLYDIFAQPIMNRNDMLEEWKNLGGRNDILDAFFTAVDHATEVVGAFKKALESVFPPMTAKHLKDMTEKFKEFVSFFKMSEPALYSLQVIVKTLLIPFRIMFELFKVGVSVVASMTKVIFTLVNAFLELAAIGNPITMLLEKIFGEERYNRLATAFDTIRKKIGDILKSIADKIKSSFGANSLLDVFLTIANTIGRVLAPIADLLLDGIVWGFEQLANMNFTSIQSFMSDMLKFFGSIGGGIITLFTTGFGNAAEALKEFKGLSLKSWFTTLKNDMKSVAGEVTGLGKAFSEEGILKNITNAASVVTGKLASIGNTLGDLVGQISPAGIIVSGLGLTFIELSHNISLAVGALAKVGTSLAGMLDSVKTVFSSVSSTIKAFGDTLKGKIEVEKLKAFALVIAAFAGALTLLALVDSKTHNIMNVVLAMGVFMAEMTAFFAVMTAINKIGASNVVDGAKNAVMKFATIMAAMAGGLLLLSSAIMVISKVDTSNIGAQLGAFLAAMLAMVMSLKILGSGDTNLEKGAWTILAFAITLKIVAKTLKMLADVDFKNVPNTIIVLGTIMLAMIGLSKLAKGITWSGGTGMIAMVMSILALTAVLSLLAKVDVGALILGVSKYILLFGAMVSLALVAKIATTKLEKGESIAKMSATFLAMAASVAVLSLAIKTIGRMPLGEVVKGTAAVSAILGMFVLITQVSKRGILDGQDAKSSFAGMAIAILTLTLAIDYLGGLDTAKLAKGTAAVAAIMGMFVLLELVEAKNKGATGSAIFIGATIAALTISMAVLTLFPFDKIMVSAVTLGLVLVAFGQAIQYMDKLGEKKGTVSTIIKMVVLIGSLTTALIILSKQDWGALLGAAAGLSAVMLAFGVTVASLQNMRMKIDPDSAIMLGGMVIALTAALMLLVDKDWKSLLAAAVALNTTMLAFVVLTKTMSVVETDLGKALKFVLQFGLLVGALAAITAGMVALINLIPVSNDILLKVTALSLILTAVAGVAYILDKASMSTKNVAKGVGSILIVMAALSAIAAAFYLLGSSSEWSSLNANNVKMMVISLTAAIVLVGICAALGVAIGTVGTMFNPAAVTSGVADVLLVLAGILAVIGVLGVVMTGLGALEKTFGISDFLSTGGKMLVEIFTNVGAAIGGFIGGIIGGVIGGIGAGVIYTAAEALTDFINAFSEIPEENLSKCMSVVTSMAQFFNSLPDTSFSLKSFIFGGQTDIKKVFNGLDSFIEGLQKMSDKVGDGTSINTTGIRKAVNAAIIISDFENSLPKTGGVVQAWFGSGDLGRFADNMASFGRALFSYFDATNDINEWSTFEDGEKAATFINDLNKKLPTTGGFLQVLLGQQDLGKFATNMSEFGNALCSFWVSTVRIGDWSLFETAASAATFVADLAYEVSEIDYGFFSGHARLSDFGSQMASLGNFIEKYNNSISNVAWTNVATSCGYLDRMVEVMRNVSTMNVTNISNFSTALASIGSTGLQAFADAFTGRDAVLSIDETSSAVIGTFISSLNSHSSNADFYGIGTRAINGIVNGINVNIGSLKSAGTRAADSLCESIEKALIINSPSKRTYKLGKFAMMGLEKGLLENQSISNSAASTVAEGILTSMKRTLEIHSPSYRVRQEVARPVLEAIPAEFDENNTAEKAAKAKGEAIFAAFKSAFTDNDEVRELLSLERELFELKLSPNLSDAERQKAIDEYNTGYQKKQLQTYVDDYKLAVQQYQTVVKEMGEESSMAKEAQRSMLQQEITLRKYASEMVLITSDTIAEATSASVESWKDYYNFLQSDEFTKILQAQLKGKIRTGEVSMLDDADPEVLKMSAVDRMKAELRAFQYAVEDGDWEKKYADALAPIKEALYKEYQNVYIDPDIEELRHAVPETADDILKEFFDGLTIDEYAMQDVAGELSESFVEALEASLAEASEKTSTAASSAGSKTASAYTSGLTSSITSTGVEDIGSAMKDALSSAVGSMEGDEDLLNKFIPNSNSITAWFDNIGNTVSSWISGLSSNASGAVDAASDVVLGFIKGAESKKPEVEQVYADIGRIPENEIRAVTQTHSPSRKLFQVGVDVIDGFIKALKSRYGLVADVSEGIADIVADTPFGFTESLIDIGQAATMAEELAGVIESTQPTITPVLDLTTVNNQLASLSSEMSSRMASQISQKMTPITTPINQNGSEAKTKDSSSPIVFNQYNSSPKALDQTEIYRQTNNQLSILKEGLKKS